MKSVRNFRTFTVVIRLDEKSVNDYINNVDSDEMLPIRLLYFVNSVEPDENVSFLTPEIAIFAKLTTILSDGNIWFMYGKCSKFRTLFLCSQMKCWLKGLEFSKCLSE